MENTEAHSRLLLPIGIENDFFVATDEIPSGDRYEIKFEFDKSAFRFIAEELISQGALRIVLDPLSGFNRDEQIDTVGAVLRRRIEVVDSDGNVQERTLVVLRPIADELGTDLAKVAPQLHSWVGPQTEIILREKDTDRGHLLESLIVLHSACYHLFLGMRYRLHIDIDLHRMWFAIQRLRAGCKSPDATTNLAFLESLVRGYGNEEIGGLRIAATGSSELVASFEEFLEDESYRQLSAARHALGVRARVHQAATATRRLARQLVGKKRFGRLFNYGSRAVSVVTGLPLPNSDVAEAIMADSYLPPIAGSRSNIATARRAWAQKVSGYRPLSISTGLMTGRKAAVPLQCFYGDDRLSASYDIHDFLEMFHMNVLPKAGDRQLEEWFKHYFSTNLQTPAHCSEHDSDIGIGSLEVEWRNTKVNVYVRGCCENATKLVLIQMLAYDNAKDYGSRT